MWYNIFICILGATGIVLSIWASVKIDQARRAGEIRYLRRIEVKDMSVRFAIWVISGVLALGLVIATLSLWHEMLVALGYHHQHHGIVWLVPKHK